MTRRREHGFTMVEMVIAILIGAVLTTIAVRSFSGSMGGIQVRQARQTFVSMQARARAHAIERGENVMLIVVSSTDQAFVWSGGELLDSYDFGSTYDVDVDASFGSGWFCFTPRGIADPDCSSSASTVGIRFVSGTESESIRVLPLGQIRQ